MKKPLYILILLLAIWACKAPEARRPVSRNSSSSIDASIQRNKALIANQEDAIQTIINQDSANTYISSSNGFWYYYSTQDTLATQTPSFGDLVTYDYSVKTLDDRVIYAEKDTKTKRYAMDQEELASGIREGLKLMHEGETATFLLPSHKAYGYYGDKNKIGRNLPIKITITVNSITTQNDNN